jgi:hypothetical protein
MTRNSKSDEASLADLAKKGLERIVKLSESQVISEKLQAINTLLFVFILTVVSTHYIGGSTTEGLSLLFVFAISFILALIVSSGYGLVLSIISNVSVNRIESLRVGITILFFSLTLAVVGLTLDSKLVSNLSLGLVALQLVITLVIGFFAQKNPLEDKKISLSQVWDGLGKISSVLGIISFVIDVILLLIKYGS